MNKKLTCFMLVFVILLTALPFKAFAANSGRDYNSFIVLTNSYFKLNPNDKIYSANKEYCLSFQEDGNLVIYNVANAWEPLWQAPGAWNNTDVVMFYENNGLIGYKYLDSKKLYSEISFEYPVKGGKYLCMQDDGVLTICDKSWNPIWSHKGPLFVKGTEYDSYTTNKNLQPYDKIYSSNKEYCLMLGENGKYAIYDLTKELKPIWETSEVWNDNVKDGKYLCMQNDGVLVIYDSSWKKIWSHKEHYLYSKQTITIGAETSVYVDINGKVTGKTTCWSGGIKKFQNKTRIIILDKDGKFLKADDDILSYKIFWSGECKAFSKKSYTFEFILTEEQKKKMHSVRILHEEITEW